MAGFTITATGIKGIIELGSTNGVSSGTPPQAYLSVGAPYGVSVSAPLFGTCPLFKVTRVVFTWLGGFGVIIRKDHPDTRAILTSYSRSSGMIEGDNQKIPSAGYFSTYDWTVANPSSSVAVDFFVGIPSNNSTYSDTLRVTAYYDSGDQDVVDFIVNSASPSTNNSTALNFQFSTSPNTFQFGPWFVGTTGTPPVISNTPVSWSDVTYWAGGPPLGGSDYALGCQAGGVAPWSFSGTIVNNTFSTGTAYCMQLGRNKGPDELSFAKTRCNLHTAGVASFLGVSVMGDKYEYLPVAPKDSSGNTFYGCDSAGDNSGSHPWAYELNAFTVPTPNGAATAVPPANSIPDANGTLNSYYSDNPGLLRHIDRTALYTTVDIEFNWDGDYSAYLVWEPDGGIPIGMAIQQYSVRCNTYNQNGDKYLTWTEGRAFQNNWNNPGGTGSYVYGNARGPFYLVWPYFLGDYSKMIPLRVNRGWHIGGGGPNSGPAGGSTFGGAPSMVAFNGFGLPNGSSSNVGGANVFGMN